MWFLLFTQGKKPWAKIRELLRSSTSNTCVCEFLCKGAQRKHYSHESAPHESAPHESALHVNAEVNATKR